MDRAHLDSDIAHRYVAGLLDARQAAEVARHLSECEPCQALVAEERGWSGLFRIREEPAGSSAGPQGLARSLNRRITNRLRRRRLGRAGLIGLVSGLVGVLAGLGYRVISTDSAQSRSASELGISPAAQSAVVAHLPALQALREDPWLSAELETVLMFEQLLIAEGG